MTTEPPHAEPADADPEPVQVEAPAPVVEAPAPVQVPSPAIEPHRTRISGVWVATGFFALLLLFLLIFILQNGHSAEISYLGLHGRLPLGVALLLSAVCGILLVVLAGTARILQLRTQARRHRRADARAAKAAKAASKAARAEADTPDS